MSGTGSNARRLLERKDPSYEVRLILTDNPASNAARIAREFGVACAVADIRAFCGAQRVASSPSRSVASSPARSVASSPARSVASSPVPGLRDPERRAAYDRELASLLARCGARLAALAGWDWVVGPELCRAFLFVNVHPGDLRVRDGEGRRRYVGLGWVPTAKAILAGERFVHSCTHLVTPELDGGPIARVSRPVPVDLPAGVSAGNILPEGVHLRDVIRDINYNGGRNFGGSLLYTHSRKVQERLKEEGDWVEFPATVQRLAELTLEGRLARDPQGAIRLDGSPPGDLFLQAG
jgi:folate-dependent phosphoribosylglycinamide formyltransferase PurN